MKQKHTKYYCVYDKRDYPDALPTFPSRLNVFGSLWCQSMGVALSKYKIHCLSEDPLQRAIELTFLRVVSAITIEDKNGDVSFKKYKEDFPLSEREHLLEYLTQE